MFHFLFDIELSVPFRFTVSPYPFGIFRLPHKKNRVTVYVFLKFMMEILKINIFNMIVMFLDEHSVWNIERHFLQYFSICGDHRNQENIIICSRPEYITDILFSFDLFAITIQTWTSFSLIIPILQKRVLHVCRC